MVLWNLNNVKLNPDSVPKSFVHVKKKRWKMQAGKYNVPEKAKNAKRTQNVEHPENRETQFAPVQH